MPTPQWLKDRQRQIRTATCIVCGVVFVGRTKGQRTCTKECRFKQISIRQTGKKQGPEAQAKRSASLKAFNAANPDKCAARAAAAIEGNLRWLKNPKNYEAASRRGKENVKYLLDGGVRECNKRALKKAAEALRLETNYVEVFTDVQARLRREFPYDGPKEGSDYAEYCEKLGRMTVQHPEVVKISRDFLSNNLSRFMRDAHNVADDFEVLA